MPCVGLKSFRLLSVGLHDVPSNHAWASSVCYRNSRMFARHLQVILHWKSCRSYYLAASQMVREAFLLAKQDSVWWDNNDSRNYRWGVHYRVRTITNLASSSIISGGEWKSSLNRQEGLRTKVNWTQMKSETGFLDLIKQLSMLNEEEETPILLETIRSSSKLRQTQTSFNPLVCNPCARKNISAFHHFHVFVLSNETRHNKWFDFCFVAFSRFAFFGVKRKERKFANGNLIFSNQFAVRNLIVFRLLFDERNIVENPRLGLCVGSLMSARYMCTTS